MDEVHYLADRSRGAVWEEVIIHLPESVALVSLSATVSNAEEFGEWLGTVRGETVTIVEERRPVPLYQHVLVGRRMYDLFADDGAARPGRRRRRGGRSTRSCCGWPATTRPAAGCATAARRATATPGGARSRGATSATVAGCGCPSRADVVERLDAAGAAAGDRVHLQPGRLRRRRRSSACNANLRLTTPEERDEIVAFVEERCADLPGRGPARPRLPRVPRRPDPRHRGAPRRHAADVQGVRRGAVPPRPVPGRLRHRDARPRASTCRRARS